MAASKLPPALLLLLLTCLLGSAAAADRWSLLSALGERQGDVQAAPTSLNSSASSTSGSHASLAGDAWLGWAAKAFWRRAEEGGGQGSVTALRKNWPKFKFNGVNAGAMAISVVGAVLANAAGVGGGGMFVPMFNMIGFDTKTATALSQAMIMGGALTSFAYNMRLQHPTQRRPLIDYDVALLLEPMLLLGISGGVVFNIVFPSWLIIALLAVLLIYMTWRTLVKGISTWQEESRKARERSMSQMVTMGDTEAGSVSTHDDRSTDSVNSQRNPSAVDPMPDMERRIVPASDEVVIEENQNSEQGNGPSGTPFLEKTTMSQLRRLNVLILSEFSIIPKWRLVEVCFIWFMFLWLQIFKGGKSSPSIVGVRSCEHWFWVIVAMQVPLCVAFTYWVVRRLRREHRERVVSGKAFEVGDVQWGRTALVAYPLMALVAGALAGLLGIGGGMVIGPILLEMGMLPQVAAATGALMVLFSASMAVAQFSILNLIPLEYALIYGSICAVAGFIGLVSVRAAIRKYGRTSIIIFSLALVIGSSAVVIVVTGVISIKRQLARHDYMGFQGLCNVS